MLRAFFVSKWCLSFDVAGARGRRIARKGGTLPRFVMYTQSDSHSPTFWVPMFDPHPYVLVLCVASARCIHPPLFGRLPLTAPEHIFLRKSLGIRGVGPKYLQEIQSYSSTKPWTSTANLEGLPVPFLQYLGHPPKEHVYDCRPS